MFDAHKSNPRANPLINLGRTCSTMKSSGASGQSRSTRISSSRASSEFPILPTGSALLGKCDKRQTAIKLHSPAKDRTFFVSYKLLDMELGQEGRDPTRSKSRKI